MPLQPIHHQPLQSAPGFPQIPVSHLKSQACLPPPQDTWSPDTIRQKAQRAPSARTDSAEMQLLPVALVQWGCAAKMDFAACCLLESVGLRDHETEKCGVLQMRKQLAGRG